MARKGNKEKALAAFLYEIGSLRKIVRAHRQSLGTDDLSDNIASHSFRVTAIGWFLAGQEKANIEKVVSMCLFHDLSEARSGDQNWVHKKYVKVFEKEILIDQVKDIPLSAKLKLILQEYMERKTKEALIAKDADLLDQILLLREYAWQGNKEAALWLKEGKDKKSNTHVKLLQTKSAKRLAQKIMSQKPTDWWTNVWTEKRR